MREATRGHALYVGGNRAAFSNPAWTYLCEYIFEKSFSVRAVAGMFDIPHLTLNRGVQEIEKLRRKKRTDAPVVRLPSMRKGRRRAINVHGARMKEFKQLVGAAARGKNSLKLSEVKSIALKIVNEHQELNNDIHLKEDVSDYLVKQAIELADARPVMAKRSPTESRIIQNTDPRNAISSAVTNVALLDHAEPHSVFNMDGKCDVSKLASSLSIWHCLVFAGGLRKFL